MGSAKRPPEIRPEEVLRQYFAKLLSTLGPQKWWPARTRIEIIIGAILVQNTAWQNVALALHQLKRKGFLTLSGLRTASQAELETCVRPAGFFRQKARTIQNFLAWLDRACHGSLGALFALPAVEARRQLLEIKGLGPETVDAILVYAGGHAFFVADQYRRRIFTRHELVTPGAGYEAVQKFLHQHLFPDPDLFNEYHALLVEAGKQFCKVAAPRCEECPLQEFLPTGRGPAHQWES
jgi:endonuclease-3 related protein